MVTAIVTDLGTFGSFKDVVTCMFHDMAAKVTIEKIVMWDCSDLKILHGTYTYHEMVKLAFY